MKEKEYNEHTRKYISDLAKKGAQIKNHGPMCSTCAFKYNSEANLEPHNVEDAAQCVIFDIAVFNCHKEIDVDAGTPCKGYLHAKQYINQKINQDDSKKS